MGLIPSGGGLLAIAMNGSGPEPALPASAWAANSTLEPPYNPNYSSPGKPTPGYNYGVTRSGLGLLETAEKGSMQANQGDIHVKM